MKELRSREWYDPLVRAIYLSDKVTSGDEDNVQPIIESEDQLGSSYRRRGQRTAFTTVIDHQVSACTL